MGSRFDNDKFDRITHHNHTVSLPWRKATIRWCTATGRNIAACWMAYYWPWWCCWSEGGCNHYNHREQDKNKITMGRDHLGLLKWTRCHDFHVELLLAVFRVNWDSWKHSVTACNRSSSVLLQFSSLPFPFPRIAGFFSQTILNNVIPLPLPAEYIN